MLTDMKIRLVILEIKVPTVKAGSRSGTKHPGRGAGGPTKGWGHFWVRGRKDQVAHFLNLLSNSVK